MNYIQTDVSGEALITATRANMNDLFRLLSSVTPEVHLKKERGIMLRQILIRL